MKKYALLIWERNPEGIDVYLIPNPTDEEIILLRSAHNTMINCSDDSSAAQIINDMICEEKEYCINPEAKYNGKWVNYKLESNTLTESIELDMIFKSGFCL